MAGRVLVVDDERDTRLLVRIILEREGFTVAEAADGQEALAAFDADQPELVLLDVRLPGMDGLNLLRTIRARTDVPIVIVSAYASSDVSRLAIGSGANGFITKPFKARELVEVVRAALAGGGTPAGTAPEPTSS